MYTSHTDTQNLSINKNIAKVTEKTPANTEDWSKNVKQGQIIFSQPCSPQDHAFPQDPSSVTGSNSTSLLPSNLLPLGPIRSQAPDVIPFRIKETHPNVIKEDLLPGLTDTLNNEPSFHLKADFRRLIDNSLFLFSPSAEHSASVFLLARESRMLGN